ncbi:winged helix-turn-helix transcriptional regulator [Amycolatopsis nigrescens]|uniref:winged helix-turn-helix transcriptional regulator n=1 Tax=Amycolatopsis nigrescens TaxID=381445 RepID=UPI00036F2761|nr:helix-turn-helix domain-containing protein [Amycolatopsis nigrescens]
MKDDIRLGGHDLFDRDCPGRAILDHVSARWATLVLTALRNGPLRFYQLRDKIGGISEKMLAQNLRVLARDGLIERTVEPTTPPQVSYELTALGHGLTDAYRQLVDWIGEHAPQIFAAQQKHDELAQRSPSVKPARQLG